MAASYSNLGSIHYARGDYDAALEWYGKSIALKEELGDRAGIATTYHNIASIYYARGDHVTALSWYKKARALQEQLGDRYGSARTLYNLDLLYRDVGNLEQALEALAHSLDILTEHAAEFGPSPMLLGRGRESPKPSAKGNGQ